MPNWCSNFVTFTGRKGNIENIYSKLEALIQQQIQSGGDGVSLLSNDKTNKYMFHLEIDDHTDNFLVLRFDTKWYVSFEDYKAVCEKFKVNITCDYEECGMGIYGSFQYLYGGLAEVYNEIPDDVMQNVIEDDDGLVTYKDKTYENIYSFVEDYLDKTKINVHRYEKENRSPD
jgi:Ferredoxin-like domain in Api92-like protein